MLWRNLPARDFGYKGLLLLIWVSLSHKALLTKGRYFDDLRIRSFRTPPRLWLRLLLLDRKLRLPLPLLLAISVYIIHLRKKLCEQGRSFSNNQNLWFISALGLRQSLKLYSHCRKTRNSNNKQSVCSMDAELAFKTMVSTDLIGSVLRIWAYSRLGRYGLYFSGSEPCIMLSEILWAVL